MVQAVVLSRANRSIAVRIRADRAEIEAAIANMIAAVEMAIPIAAVEIAIPTAIAIRLPIEIGMAIVARGTATSATAMVTAALVTAISPTAAIVTAARATAIF